MQKYLQSGRAYYRGKLTGIYSRMQNFKGDPFKLIWVKPDKIVNAGIGWGRYSKRSQIGRVRGGNWDLNCMPFAELDVYKAFQARFLDGKGWEETSYYQMKFEALDRSNPADIHHADKSVRACFDGYDRLFRQIQQTGFKAKRELSGKSGLEVDEVTVRIDRHGQFLFEDGRHRLAIAKILKIQKIPVLVTWRHKNWVQTIAHATHNLRRYSFNGGIPSELSHSDLDHSCLTPQKKYVHYFNLIKANLPMQQGTLLHIGAGLGTLCHWFEEEGFRCYAMENNKAKFKAMEALRMVHGKQFTMLFLNVHEFIEKSEFDIVIMLEMDAVYMKSREDFEKLMQFFSRLKAQVLIIEPPIMNSPSPGKALQLNEKEFIELISEKTGLKKVACIGYSYLDHPLYQLTQ